MNGRLVNFVNALWAIFFENASKASTTTEPYDQYLANTKNDVDEKSLAVTPLISIIIFGTDLQSTKPTVNSLRNQSYKCWEAVILTREQWTFGDSRISLCGTSSISDGVSQTGGDYIMFMDSGDTMPDFALMTLTKNIGDCQSCDAFYSDDDLIIEGKRTGPSLKPDYSPDTLLSTNYIGRLFAVSRDLYNRCGGLKAADPAGEYDYVLRACDEAVQVSHIAAVLYSRGNIPLPIPNDRGIKSINSILKKKGNHGFATCGSYGNSFHTHFYMPKNHKCEIIVYNGDNADRLINFMNSIENVTCFDGYSITVLSRGTTDTRLIRYENALKNNGAAKVLGFGPTVSFAKMCNTAVLSSNADQLVFIEAGVTPLMPDWLDGLSELATRRDIGIVSPLVMTSDKRVVSAGNIIGIGDWWDVPYKNEQITYTDSRMNSIINTQRNVSLPGFDCFMISTGAFSDSGGFDESFFGKSTVAELSIKLMWKYRRNIYTPFVKMLSIQSEFNKPDPEDEQRAYDVLRTELLNGDKYYNRAFDRKSTLPTVKIR